MTFKRSINGFAAYRNDEQGNVAVVAGLAVIPILSICGMAIDLQMMNTNRNQVQAVIDSSVIAGAKLLQAGADIETIEKDVQNYVDALMAQRTGNMLKCDDVDVDVNYAEEVIDASVSCSQATTLSALYGKESLDFTIGSGSTYGMGKVEVAFIFDVSGSMKGDKIDDLKDAALDAVDMIMPDVQGNSTSSSDDVRLAMVSYDTAVNVGSYFEAVTGEKKNRKVEVEEETETCTGKKKSKKKGKKKKGWGSSSCTTTTETVEKSVSGTCVVERLGDNMLTDAAPNASNGWIEAQFEEETNKWGTPTGDYVADDCNDQEILPLTSNRVKLEKYIDDMDTRSSTAGHLGIAWGWYMLSPEWDDVWKNNSRAEEYDAARVTKAIILMTDGEFNSKFSDEYDSSAEWAEAYCDEIKKKDVVIYSVAFEAPKEGQDILKKCSTSDDHYFEAKSGAELKAAYKKIAQAISDLRISY